MNSTIVAPMTPSGVSAIAAIRVSGKAVRSILSEALLNTDPKPRHAYYGDFRHLQTKKILDSLLYIFFEAKHSYTGEDVLELRSEEHTSELQSRPHLVCRLLLEKKKKK